MQVIEEIVTRHLTPAENYIYGYADLNGLLTEKFRGFNYGISIGRRLDDNIIDSIINGPTEEYYNHYLEINELLASLTDSISYDLNASGIESINIEPTISTDDTDSSYSDALTTDLSHKMVATRAGLGWIGKTDLFISKTLGPRLRLVTILVRTPLKPVNAPVKKSRCGKCDLCVKICPAGAASDKLWNTEIRREDFFDPWKCRKQCAYFGRSLFDNKARICGICIAICPVGRNHRNDNQ
jgi:epoxyqueuosine reductase